MVAPTLAHAGGFATTRFGGEHGHAATDDPTAVFYNPAGVAYADGTQGYVEGLFAFRTVTYTRDAGAIDNAGTGTPNDAVDRNAGKATLANPIVSPFAGVVVDGLPGGLSAGLSFSAPFGGQASWDKDQRFANDRAYPGAVDGVARWSSIEGLSRSLFYSGAIGWRTADGTFGVGVGVHVVQSAVNLVRARNADGSDDLVLPGGAIKEGRSLLDVEGIDVAASVGVMWKPTPCSRVGLAYVSQPGFGEMRLKGTLTNQFGDSAPSGTDLELRQSLPDTLRAGGVWRAAEKVVLHAAVDFQRWSQFKNQCFVTPGASSSTCTADDDGQVIETSSLILNIPRAWKNSFGVRIGGSYEVSPALEVNGGVLYDSSAVPDATLEPALIDMPKIIPQLGLRYRTGKVLLSTTLGYVGYLDRSTEPRASDPSPKNRNPDMAGDYSQRVVYALAGVGVSM